MHWIGVCFFAFLAIVFIFASGAGIQNICNDGMELRALSKDQAYRIRGIEQQLKKSKINVATFLLVGIAFMVFAILLR